MTPQSSLRPQDSRPSLAEAPGFSLGPDALPASWLEFAGLQETDLFLLRELLDLAQLESSARRRDGFEMLAILLAAGRRGSTRIQVGHAAASFSRECIERLDLSLSTPRANRDWRRTLEESRFARLVQDHSGECVKQASKDKQESKELPLGMQALRPLVYEGEGERVYLSKQRDWALERELASLVASRLKDRAPTSAPVSSPKESEHEGELFAPSLSEEQVRARNEAKNRRLLAITGGPGTGKTTVLASLIADAFEAGLEPTQIALAAPTGKAAFRMREALIEGLGDAAATLAPVTLHRLLGFDPRSERFRRHRGDPLEAQLIVVDEASMIDLRTMERLLAAIPSTARLILSGDADQLPSVDAGAVFRDLEPKAGVRLKTNFRQRGDSAGKSIADLAACFSSPALLSARSLPGAKSSSDGTLEPREIRTDDPELRMALDQAQCTQPSNLSWTGLEFIDLEESSQADSLQRVLARWFDEIIDPRQRAPELFDSKLWPQAEPELAQRRVELLRESARSRILSATRIGPSGTESLNAFFGARLRAEGAEVDSAGWIAGQPIMMNRNDDLRGLFNGDQGLVLPRTMGASSKSGSNATSRSGLEALFLRDEKPIVFSLASLESRIEPAFATTVHKSQGSEFERILFLFASGKRPLRRELVYTAITRARAGALLIGPRSTLEAAQRSFDPRDTGFADALEVAMKG